MLGGKKDQCEEYPGAALATLALNSEYWTSAEDVCADKSH